MRLLGQLSRNGRVHTLIAVLIALAGLSEAAHAQPSGDYYNKKCITGPEVSDEFCHYFVKYRPLPYKLDPNLRSVLGITGAHATARSIALIFGAVHYKDGDLKAVNADFINLVHFFADEQNFDEVIVLRDPQITRSLLDKFLTDYLYNQGIDPGNDEATKATRLRLAIAYSGHGTNVGDPMLLLGNNDYDHTFAMSDFRDRIEKLAPRYFHVLTLINTCYGGNVFGTAGSGGNSDDYRKPGSIAFTSSSADKQSYSVDPSKGSLFFSTLIKGVESGKADPTINIISDANGKTISLGGMTRLLQLEGYMTTQMPADAAANSEITVSFPWFGAIEPKNEISEGGFFFFSPSFNVDGTKKTTGTPINNHTAAFGYAMDLNVPRSAVPNHPELKLFEAPPVYPIQGFDFSSAEGDINWKRVSKAPKPNFIYARLDGWSEPDPTDKSFANRWANIAQLGIARGAYHKFNFCLDVPAQMKLIKHLPADSSSLPFAIELVEPGPQSDPHQFSCYRAMGVDQAKNRILDLADGVQKYFGKVPMLAANRVNLGKFTDERARKYMLWIYAYGKDSSSDYSYLRLTGNNPWTLWQFTGTAKIPGLGGNITSEVFFGDQQQFEKFKRGDANIALEATAQHD